MDSNSTGAIFLTFWGEPMKKIMIVVAIVASMAMSAFAGYQYAIKQAVLTGQNLWGYELTFNGSSYWYDYSWNEQ